MELVGGGSTSLPCAYQKYKAYHVAWANLEQMVKDGTWVGKKPTMGDVKDIFASRSYFSSHYKKFAKVTDYPDLVDWLDNKEGKLSDEEVWGISKTTYHFSDLDFFLKNGGSLALEKLDVKEGGKEEGKGKGKGKEKKEDKDRGRKGKAKGKGKEKEDAKEEKKGKKKDGKNSGRKGKKTK
jgi:hypothetical protein